MKPVRFHPDAESEMVGAASWYEAQQENSNHKMPQYSGMRHEMFIVAFDTLRDEDAHPWNVFITLDLPGLAAPSKTGNNVIKFSYFL